MPATFWTETCKRGDLLRTKTRARWFMATYGRRNANRKILRSDEFMVVYGGRRVAVARPSSDHKKSPRGGEQFFPLRGFVFLIYNPRTIATIHLSTFFLLFQRFYNLNVIFFFFFIWKVVFFFHVSENSKKQFSKGTRRISSLKSLELQIENLKV